MKILVAVSMVVTATAAFTSAKADDCPTVGFSGGSSVSRYGHTEFYKYTKFGTIGISFGYTGTKSSPIWVLDDGVNCIGAKRPKNVQIYMNHRNSKEGKTGYVSFKIYGLVPQRTEGSTLKLRRSGAWLRGKETIANPWEPKPITLPAIVEYEKFYAAAAKEKQETFEKDFGVFHGKPLASDYESWADLQHMRPDLARTGDWHVRYLFHQLQRVTSGRSGEGDEEPPRVYTERTENPELIIAIYSPLNETVRRTITVRFDK